MAPVNPNFHSLNILLPTLGSAGDVHPTIALGLALKARGHRATILTNEFFAAQIRSTGLDYIPFGTIAEGEKALADPRLWHPTKGFACVAEHVFVPNIRRLYRLIEEHRNAHTVVAASGPCLGARVANEKLGVPLATIHLQPALLRSMYDSASVGQLPLGSAVPRFLKRALFWAADEFWVDKLLGPELNALRGELGLAPVRSILGKYIHSPQLVLGLFPDWLAAPQPDWPRNVHLTGFVMYDADTHFAVSEEAQEFLDSGPPPILFTPGSGAATLGGFFRASVETCRRTGLRGMLVTNFPEQLPKDLPPGVRAFSYLPFSQVMPRCAAIVYPGGIGTLAQSVKAGIPQLVVPYAHDQPDNAARVERLGLGHRLYPEQYRAEKIIPLLKDLLSSTAMRERCRFFSGKIDSAAAIERDCSLIEGLAAQPNGRGR